MPFLIFSPTLTDDKSTTFERFCQALANQASISRDLLQNEAVRQFFVGRDVAKFQCLQETGTSTSPSTNFIDFLFPRNISIVIREYLGRLFREQEEEKVLYDISILVAEWLIKASNEYHSLISTYIKNIPLISKRVLLSALSDAEFSTTNELLLSTVSLFLNSTDKRLAQTAAVFLLTCGGTMGKNCLSQALSTQELPHSHLIKGISELLS
ncbi:hypothetical protein Syn6312_1229 [Synechococcus sp. PCC 6312]|nr:hypothetical protein Syn6312_1229 [Synechococcus sp. PCC 6312]